MDCKWIDPIHVREVDLEWNVMGAAFCPLEFLFLAHRLYTSAMVAGVARVLRLYYRFLL